MKKGEERMNAADGEMAARNVLDIGNGRWVVADEYGRRFLGQLPVKLHEDGETFAMLIEKGKLPNVLALFPSYELNTIQQTIDDGRTILGLHVLPQGIFAIGAPCLVRWSMVQAVHELPDIDKKLLRDGLSKAEDMKNQFRAARGAGLSLEGPPRVSLK